MPDIKQITPEQYRKAFITLSKTGQLPDHMMAILTAHYRAPDHIATATELAQTVGYETYNPVNRWYGELAMRAAQEIGWTPPKNETWLQVFVEWEGHNDDGHLPLKMRENVVKALESLGW